MDQQQIQQKKRRLLNKAEKWRVVVKPQVEEISRRKR